MRERLVIVGAGLAGHRAAQAARREGFDGELTMVGDEVHKPYDRPPLSKQLLAGTMERGRRSTRTTSLDVEWVLGSPATALDTDRRRGHARPTGSSPVRRARDRTGRRAREWPDLPATWRASTRSAPRAHAALARGGQARRPRP